MSHPKFCTLYVLSSLLLLYGCATTKNTNGNTSDLSMLDLYRKGFLVEVINKSKNASSPYLAQDMLFVSRAYNELALYDGAYEVSEKAINTLSTDSKNEKSNLQLLLDIEHAHASIGKGHLVQGQLEIRALSNKLTQSTDVEVQALVLRLNSRYHFEVGDIRMAQTLLEQGLEMLHYKNSFRSYYINYDFTTSLLLADLGTLMQFLDNTEKAYGIHTRVLQLSKWSSSSNNNLRLTQCLIKTLKNIINEIEIERSGSFDLFDSESNPKFAIAYQLKDDIYRRLVGVDRTLAAKLRMDAELASARLELIKDSQFARQMRRKMTSVVKDFPTEGIDSLFVKLDSLENSLNPSDISNLLTLQDLLYLKSICHISTGKAKDAVLICKKALTLSSQLKPSSHPFLIRPIYYACYALMLEFAETKDPETRKEIDSLAIANIQICKQLLSKYKMGATPVDMLSISTSFIREPFSLYILVGADKINKEYQTVAYFKNYAKRHEAYIHKMAKFSNDSIIKTKYQELSSLARKESDLVYKQWYYESGDSYEQVLLRETSMRKDKTWRELSEMCHTSSAINDSDINVEILLSNLSKDEAVIDFLSLTMADGTSSFFAYVLSKDNGIQKEELAGRQLSIEEDVQVYRKLMESEKQIESDLDEEYVKLCKYISDDLWYPYEKHISKDTKTLYIIPDGILSGFPFSTLRHGNNYLIDKYSIVYKTHISDFKRRQKGSTGKTKIFVAGGVAYGKSTAQKYTGPFSRLDHSKIEAKNLAEALNPNIPDLELYLNINDTITESYFKTIAKTFDLIHISTHGFVADIDSYDKLLDRRRGEDSVYPPYLFLGSLHPSIRCGLAFTYANLLSEDAGPWGQRNPKNNGLLTAPEISFLDLTRSRLIVLSACNTNTGLYFSGEGIVNLTTSFQFAGANDIVSTLFRIEDRGTSLFMNMFYQRYLQQLKTDNSIDIGQILSETSIEIRNYKVGEKRLFSSPRYWVPFVAYSN